MNLSYQKRVASADQRGKVARAKAAEFAELLGKPGQSVLPLGHIQPCQRHIDLVG